MEVNLNDLTTEAFKYQKLKLPTSTRIVVLLRGSGNNPIECFIHEYDIAHIIKAINQTESRRDSLPIPGGYKALSYEWGLPSDDDPMILLDKGNVRIRKNLHDALRHLRLEDQDRSFWIDALSIDQNNLRERAQQIKIMGHIYRAADEVISWLSPAKDGSDFAMGVLDTEPELWAHEISSLLPDETQAFVALYRRSYRGRVWILQDIYNARSFVVQCGSKSISGAKFFDRVSRIWNNLPLKQESAAESIRCSGPGVKGSSVTASEPRDYVYALLGTSADYCPDSTKGHTIAPDYVKPLLEVYLEAAAFCRMPLSATTSHSSFSERYARMLGLKFDDIPHSEVAQRYGLEYDDYTHAHLKQSVHRSI